MDKSITIVNENLRQVINGIREHLNSSKKHFESIENEMNEKVNIAQQYKETVVESKNKINSIEDEISSLERDLDDLNNKFGGTDFKEILSAGNKEINSKIIEKRAIVQKESQKILDLTNKAKELKEELINLKEKKRLIEKDIKETTVVEKFYAAKVNEIIDYTEAGNDLELYVDNTPQAELMTNNDYQKEFVEVSKVLNDHVFDEIDEITTNEPDESLVEQALKNVVSKTYDSESVQINDIKEALEKDMREEIQSAPQVEEVTTVVPEETTQVEEVATVVPEVTPVEEVKVEEEPLVVAEPIKDGIEEKSFQAIVTEDLTKKGIVEVPQVEEVTTVVPEETTEDIQIDMDAPFADTPIDVPEDKEETEIIEGKNNEESDEDSLNALIEKTLNNMSYPSFNSDSIDLNLLEDDLTDENTAETETIALPGEENYEEEKESDDIELDIADDTDDNTSNDSELDNEDLSLLGIDTFRLSSDDLSKLKKSNQIDLKKNIGVLSKHNVSIDDIYSNVNILTDMNPDKIDSILTLLEDNKKGVKTVIPVLDKIDVEKLQTSLEVNKNEDVINIILPTIDSVDDVIKTKLNMSDEEYETLKSNVSEETLKKLNILSYNVVENYKVLDNLGISNIRECLTKYPSKLMLDINEFKEVLDKYDQDDLVRCINKNPKVFDKI
ncbi:MAG: hypothetical protein K6E99_00785 [Bacilli bacterium]|nr:hypothetical protein [Bacilli bacterium]